MSWNFPVSEETVGALRANAIPIATAEPGNGTQDLEFLRSIVGDSRILSMGEATHGTREFAQLKQRVIEYCVSHLGFTVIGLETHYGKTLAINDYVLNGKGSAAKAVAGTLVNTEEAVALVEWVRDWNIAHDRKVSFFGFDMQECLPEAQHLFKYLQRVDPVLAATTVELTTILPPYAWSPIADTVQNAVVARIRELLTSFDAKRDRWIKQTSKTEWHSARQSAVVVAQCVGTPRATNPEEYSKFHNWRERCMAENVRTLLEVEGPGAKAVLWAHNLHVRRSPWRPNLLSMGGLLHAEFGAQQVVVGFGFNQGKFSALDGARRLVDHTVGPAPAGFLDAALARTGLPFLALDFRSLPSKGPVAEWMASKPLQRSVGGGFQPARWNSVTYWYQLFHPYAAEADDPRDNYDVLLFVEKSNATRWLG
jgi:erythromycin esterase